MKEILIATITSGALSTVISALINNLNNKNNSNKALMCLMGYEIRRGCKEALKTKKISFNELKQLEEMNVTYHSLGGNGYIKTLMEKIEKLEIVED